MMPATNLNMTSSALPALPTRVILYICLSLSITYQENLLFRMDLPVHLDTEHQRTEVTPADVCRADEIVADYAE